MTPVSRGWTLPRIRGLFACLLVLAQLSGCGDSSEQPRVSEPVRPVKTFLVNSPSSGDRIELSGEIQAPEPVDLAFSGVGGEIVEFPIAGREGQAVMKGELLAQMDPAEFEAVLGKAEKKLQEAYSLMDSVRAETDRMEKMRRITPDLVTDSMLERAQAQLKKAEADIESQEAQVRKAEGLLERSSLRAPFGGLLVRCLAKPGQTAQPDEPVATLQDMTHLDIRLDASDQVSAAAREPAKADFSATIRFPSVPDKAFPLQIKDAATAPDPKTGEYRILLRMDKPEGIELPEGTIGTVTLTSNGLKLGVGTLLVPAISVMTDPDGQDYLWIIDESAMRAQRRDIRMGRIAGSDQVQVVGGLAGGERIIVAGVRLLREGQRVRLWEGGKSSKRE